ncbi:cobalamin-dependent protein, partial [Nanoarchaeota archaeon]
MIETDILYVHPFGEQVYSSENFFLSDTSIELKDHNSPKYYSYIPMGLIGTLNNVIAKGYTVRGVNLPFKKAILGTEMDYLKEFSAKVVLIDLHWYVHMKNGLEVAKFCKSFLPRAKVIVGGMTATIFAQQLVKYDCVDYVILGDSEKPFSLLIENILGGKKNKVPNLVSKE